MNTTLKNIIAQINNLFGSDVFDSHDLIEQIEALESEKTEARDWIDINLEKLEEKEDQLSECEREELLDHEQDIKFLKEEIKELEQENDDNLEYIKEIEHLLEKIKSLGLEEAEDYEYGATFIDENHFIDYCQEFLEECDMLPKDLANFIVIDWEATARNMDQDYRGYSFYFEGNKYNFKSR